MTSLERFLSALFLFTCLLRAAEDHSHHDVGAVHFPVSCAPAAQDRFDRALALLHSFWYDEAERTFAEVLRLDPRCAMAHWGVAMSLFHPLWAAPTPADLAKGAAAVDKAKSLAPGTQREAEYIAAIQSFYKDWQTSPHRDRAAAWCRGMERLAARYPGDSEARIFFALALLGTASPSDKSLRNQKRAAAILNRILPEQPSHPGIAHYLIHSYDTPLLANLALPAARSYAKVAPVVPHALHMPSHIFTRLGMWQESIDSNLASARAAREIAAKRYPGATSQDELHAMDYLVYAYLQTAQDEQAGRIVADAGRVSKVDQQIIPAAYALAAIPARYALERRRWADAASLEPHPSDFLWADFSYAQAITYYARALGAARSGNPAAARADIQRLASIGAALSGAALQYDWASQVELQRLSADAWRLHAEGAHDEALRTMRLAADLEDKTEKHPVTPGAVLPARELLADLLMELDSPRLALAEYEAVLRAAPRRFNSVYGAARAAELSGNRERAHKRYAELLLLAAQPEGRRLEIENARAYLRQDRHRSRPRSRNSAAL